MPSPDELSGLLVRDQAKAWCEEGLLAEATAIADRIWSSRTYTKSGEVTWLGPSGYGTEAHPLSMKPLGPYLYHGITGVALFLAAMDYVRKGDGYRELSLQAVAPVRRLLEKLIPNTERLNRLRMPIGGLIGLASLIYGFLRIGQLLSEDRLIREAHRITNLLTPLRIGQDEKVRIQTGSAGAVLALLALHRKIPEANSNGHTPLEIAIACGQHLLEKRISYDGLPQAWPLSPGKPPLAGFSYGAVGICYALLALFDASSDTRFRDAALEGLAFVRTLYSQEHKNWRDIRIMFQSKYRLLHGNWKDWWASGNFEQLEPKKIAGLTEVGEAQKLDDRFSNTWCHGAPGIILGHLDTIQFDNDSLIRQEILDALDSLKLFVRSRGFIRIGADDLCCGHMGVVEVLNCAHQKLNDEDCLAAAKVIAYQVWRRARCNGRYELSAARGANYFAPTLFQGISGVGYTFLRLVNPQALPSLLLLE